MKIYTKAGDQGNTSLLGGAIVSKDNPRVEAYGSVDELNASLGIVLSVCDIEDLSISLRKIQSDLFTIGARLSSKTQKTDSIHPSRISDLESQIDLLDPQMPPLSNFILPGGSALSSHLHLSRTVCRRAERSTVTLAKTESIDPNILIYLNRLGDLLFVMARFVNYKKKIPDILWKGK